MKKIFLTITAFLCFALFPINQVFAQSESDDFANPEYFGAVFKRVQSFPDGYTEEDFFNALDNSETLADLESYMPDTYDEAAFNDFISYLDDNGYLYEDEDYDKDIEFDDYDDYSDSAPYEIDHSTQAAFLIQDQVGLLSSSQLQSIKNRLQRISENYELGVYVAIIQDYKSYGSEIEKASEKIYNQNMLGLGNQRHGLLLLLSMNDRGYDLASHGEYGNIAFSDARKTELKDSFLPYLRNNDWASGVEAFVDCAERILQVDRSSGKSYKTMFEEKNNGYILICVIIGVVIALIFAFACLGNEKKKMNNVAFASEADSYISDDGVEFFEKKDIFKYSTSHTTTVKSSSSSGGGGSGFSHSSGHF